MYQYNDWITITDTIQREQRLRLHIQEVSKLITPDVAKGGSSKATGSVMAYYERLNTQLEKLVRANRGKRGGGHSHPNFNGAY